MGKVRWARVHWVRRDTLAWKGPVDPAVSFTLNSLPLIPDSRGLPEAIRAKFPHLRDYHALLLDGADLPKVPEILRGEIVISAFRGGKLIDATAPQIAGVLDDLYCYDGPLGVTWQGEAPTLRLWAPTARSVRLLLRDHGAVAMSFDRSTGIWSITGYPDWRDRFYRYEVEVFVRSTGRIEKNVVTDPYSLSLSTNSEWSQIVDLDDPQLAPEGWASLQKPPARDIVVYELHVRDFSMSDPLVPPEHRGTFMAFTHAGSYGMRHLRALASAGLTHLQLLPVADFASVNEIRAEHRDPGDLSRFPPDSPEQQAAIRKVKDIDGFNWGYDPLHYTVPEGSYSTDLNGTPRIREFRAMVQALAAAGLRVVMDVVYNHTYAAGQHELSILDRIVPGYYHRLDAQGVVETSSCCPNTAAEHAMMEKLMIDSALTWATAYKVGGFRVDLMGHHMKSNIVKLRQRLDEVDPSICLYGEGWDFGEVAHNARGFNATQRNMAGTGIGTFNDHLRNAVRGGGAFWGLQEPGFASGRPEDAQRAHEVRLGLAGSLEQFGGFRRSPLETVNYAAAHDNETLFDAIQLKVPRQTPMSERVRMNNLAVSVVMLAQGIAFFHGGDELLRSKSLDRNSYNSGDWFNRLDFTLQSSNFGVGLPPAPDNEKNWPLMRPLLADPSLKPEPADIRRSLDHFLEMLQIRKSSALFRLWDARLTVERLKFHPAEPGLIAMTLRSESELVLVVFNAYPVDKTVAISELAGAPLELHPVQQASSDASVRLCRFDRDRGGIFVTPLTTAVFLTR